MNEECVMYVIKIKIYNKTFFYTKSLIERNNKPIRQSENFKFAKFIETLEETRKSLDSIIKTRLYPLNVLNIDAYRSVELCIVSIGFGEPLEIRKQLIHVDFY